jgi:hypothetical protein
MMTVRFFLRGCAGVLAAVWVLGYASSSTAGNPLSGAALEDGCRAYAEKAEKNSKKWMERDCGKKMSLAPQIMDTDFNWQYRRCIGSVGTSIDADLQEQEKLLKQCRGVTAGTGVVTPPTGTNPPSTPPPGPQPPQPKPPTSAVVPPSATGNMSAGDVWDLVVINSVDLARSQQTYRIPAPLNGRFKGQNLVAGNPDFEGEVSGSAFRAVMTDRTGYRAEFFGRTAASGRIEGTGCDNRNRSFSYTLIKR